MIHFIEYLLNKLNLYINFRADEQRIIFKISGNG